jgi:hypothetical protein
MDVYLNKAAVATLCKAHKGRFDPPTPDVVIGRSSGWKRSRVRGGKVSPRAEAPLILLSRAEVAQRLTLDVARVNSLRSTPGTGFPDPAARIADTVHARTPPTGGWDGQVYGWHEADIARFAAQTGRGAGATRGARGRPKGSGDYTKAQLPRCGRPLTESVNGKGKPCRAVRRKIDGQWAPACGIHLTEAERATLGLAPPPVPAHHPAP